MNFNTVDLESELNDLREKLAPQVLDEVHEILANDVQKERDIEKRLVSPSEEQRFNPKDFNQEHIYTLDQIRSICIKYRLRFLDSKVFAGEIPKEAILKIKALEKEQNKTLEGFKIIAPKKLFKLEERDSDPLLFLQLTENKFYFIHKWGGELNRFRSLAMAPMRSFMSMFWFLLGVAFLFSLAIPTSNSYLTAFLFIHSFIAICGIASMLIFMFRENFSDAEWNSKFFT